MEDEDVEERENDEENLLSESPELQSLAIGTTIGNKWKILGYLQYCKFGFTQIVADLTKSYVPNFVTHEATKFRGYWINNELEP